MSMADINKDLDDQVVGDTLRFLFEFQQNTGTEAAPVWVPIDITGYKVHFTLKTNKDDADVDAILQTFATAGDDQGGANYPDDLVNGKMYVAVGSDVSMTIPVNKYFFDFRRVIPGTPPDVLTIRWGQVKFIDNITDDPQ